MNSRFAVIVAAAALVAPATLAPATAAPRKPITGTFKFRDATPDPTGNANGSNELHCNGRLPKEQPFKVKVPAAGKIKIVMSEYIGDWSLQVLDDKGKVLGGDDVNPPEYESATIKIKKAMTIGILPCNLGGTPDATGKYTITF